MLQNFIQIFGKYDGEQFILNMTGYLTLLVLVIFAILFAVCIGRLDKKIKTKQLVFAGMALALAMVTSYIKILSLPFGGSITLFSMFFICLIGYLYGPKVGITTAFAYGIFQLISDPYIIHPAQLLLDYILGFGALGLAGFFYMKKNGLIIGCIVGMFGRYICSVLSGYIFFRLYAPEGWNPLIYSLAYNGLCILTEAAITVGILLVPSVLTGLSQVKKMATQA